VAELAVINASPLIFLSRGRHLDLLAHFAGRFLVPEAVAQEIRLKGPDDITVRALETTPWIEVCPAPTVPDIILEWGLGAGESSVLAFALKHAGVEAIIDDLAARKCAAGMGIPVRGTLGIVLVAKKRGLIPSARVVMEDLIQAGLYLSRRGLDDALKRVGE
jgi:predicted nucleic acid-binding protein